MGRAEGGERKEEGGGGKRWQEGGSRYVYNVFLAYIARPTKYDLNRRSCPKEMRNMQPFVGPRYVYLTYLIDPARPKRMFWTDVVALERRGTSNRWPDPVMLT